MKCSKRKTVSILIICAMILGMFHIDRADAIFDSGRAGQMYEIICDNQNVIITAAGDREHSIREAEEGANINIAPQTGYGIVETPSVETVSIERVKDRESENETHTANQASVEVTSCGDGTYTFVMPAAAVKIHVVTQELVPIPSETPTATPSIPPTATPAASATAEPSASPVPTVIPSEEPSPTSSAEPTATPSIPPTATPSASATAVPSVSPVPTVVPSKEPSPTSSAEPAATPTASATAVPSVSPVPTAIPSKTPTPTVIPSAAPTASPSEEPTASPSIEPTASPSQEPTVSPSTEPTVSPGEEPTAVPSTSPTLVPPPILLPSAAPDLPATPSQTPVIGSKFTVAKTSMSLFAYCKVKSKPKKGIYVPSVHMKEKIKVSYDSKNYTVRFLSSDPKTASVDKNGVVKGVKMGYATVMVLLYKKNDSKKLYESQTVEVTVKPTIYINYLTGKKYVSSGGKKFTKKRGIRFCVIGTDKPFYLFYQSGKKKYTVYANKKWKKNARNIPVKKKTWIPLSGKSYKFFIATDKKNGNVFNSNVIVWKV